MGRSVIAILLACLLALAAACDGGGGDGQSPGADGPPAEVEQLPRLESTTELVTKADFPVALAVAPDGRLFYNEFNTGDVRVVTADGELLAKPFAHVDVASQGYPPSEWGLIGLALDPDFQENGYVYVYYMEPIREVEPADEIRSTIVAKPVVVRFTDQDSVGVDQTVILDDLPESDPEKYPWHVAGNLHFGPDGFLYVSIGDMRHAELAVDLSIAQGKILRVNKEDGSAPADNPLVGEANADPRIYAYAFRNPFDFAIDPATGALYAADNGDLGCDELNVVRPGEDHGWRGVSKPEDCLAQEGVPPIYLFARPGLDPEESTVAPSGMEYVGSDRYPALTGSLLVCEWTSGHMRRLVLNESGDQVIDEAVVVEDCLISIAAGPDGTIYYSNQEEVRRLVTVEEPTEAAR